MGKIRYPTHCDERIGWLKEKQNKSKLLCILLDIVKCEAVFKKKLRVIPPFPPPLNETYFIFQQVAGFFTIPF